MPDPMTAEERLAALLDGRLDERQRTEVMAQLASSDEAFEVFADAAAVTRELEEDGDAVPLRPKAARPPWPRKPGGYWIALAALLAGLALTPWIWSRVRVAGLEDPDRYVSILASRDEGLPSGWNGRPWRVTRGPSDPITPEARAVRLGVREVDLELALRARDPSARQLAAEIVVLLEGARGGALAARSYREIGRRAGEPPELLAPLLREGREGVAAVVGAEDADLVRLGAWAEAGRLAAQRRDAGFFRSRESRGALRRAAELTAGNESAHAAVERVRAAGGETGEVADWGDLESGLTELLGVLGS